MRHFVTISMLALFFGLIGWFGYDFTVGREKARLCSEQNQRLAALSKQNSILKEELHITRREKSEINEMLNALQREKGDLERKLSDILQAESEIKKQLSVEQKQRAKIEKDLTVANQLKAEAKERLYSMRQEMEEIKKALSKANQSKTESEKSMKRAVVELAKKYDDCLPALSESIFAMLTLIIDIYDGGRSGWLDVASHKEVCTKAEDAIAKAIMAAKDLEETVVALKKEDIFPSAQLENLLGLRQRLTEVRDGFEAYKEGILVENGKVYANQSWMRCRIQAHEYDIIFCKVNGRWLIQPKVVRQTLLSGTVVFKKEVICHASSGVSGKGVPPWGCLIMRIGGVPLGKACTQGEARTIESPVDGAIEMKVNDSSLDDNSGSCDYSIVLLPYEKLKKLVDSITALKKCLAAW